MNEELKEELEALCIAYLTQNIKEFPNGVPVDYLERTFPEKMEEPHDWYRSTFKVSSVMAALQSIPKAVRISYRGNSAIVSLNKSSDKVDQHLVDLVTHQRASSKKKRSMGARSHSQRVLDSFTLNRRSTHNYNTENRFKRTDRKPTGSTYNSNRSPSTNHESVHWNRSTVYHNRPVRSAPNDPRAAANDPRLASVDPWAAVNDSTYVSKDPRTSDPRASHNIVPPQVRPMTTASLSSATPSKQSAISYFKASTSSSTTKSHASTSSTKPPYKTLGDQVKSVSDSRVQELKERLKNNLWELLTTKFESLKVFYLASIYKEEYKEEIEPSRYGHKTMTDLLSDPVFKDHIRIVFDHPFNFIRAVNKGELQNGKENLASRQGNSSETDISINTAGPLMDRSNNISNSRIIYNAIDPFNVRTMLQSLEPLRDINPTLGNLQVEDIIKYRTMRIIHTSPDMTLKLDDWENKYSTEFNIRIRIQDYGFRSNLQFFKRLAVDIPIKIRLLDDKWIAKSDVGTFSKWLNETMAAGKYRAITASHKKYDMIAFPNETYPVFDLKSLPRQDYYRVTIMSVNYPHKMWLQFKTQETIAAHLSIETSLTSYLDYKRKDTFSVPNHFIKVGFPCVAYDGLQQRWCRAAVVDAPKQLDEESNITVFLVDYGVTRHVKKSQLQCILKNHLILPVGLIYAQLHGVSQNFEKMAKMTLQEYTNPPVVLACKILSTMHTPTDDVDIRWQSRKSIFNVTLIDTRQGRDCNLATAINNCNSTADDAE